MIFSKYKMAQLPNGKYLVVFWDFDIPFLIRSYPRYWDNINEGMFCHLTSLNKHDYNEVGSDTMKEAIEVYVKVVNYLVNQKKIKYVYKWTTEASMLADMDKLE